MGDVAKEGRTIIFVSHIMPMIESLCPRSVLLGDGKVVFDGRSNEVIDLYQGKSDEKIDASDLSKVVSREGEGSVRFASFFACVPETKAAPACGQPCCFEITLHSSTLRAIRNVRLSIVVSNTNNQPLIIFDTPVSFGEISNLDLNKKIRCMIPELPLSGGKYLVRLYLESNKIMLDNIRGIQISVSARDYFGTGKTAVKDWEARTVLTRHSWIV
jgi:lipopolysaccharide transport system ATP-binding protein